MPFIALRIFAQIAFLIFCVPTYLHAADRTHKQRMHELERLFSEVPAQKTEAYQQRKQELLTFLQRNAEAPENQRVSLNHSHATHPITALARVMTHFDDEVVEQMIKHGADVNAQNVYGTTPAMATENIKMLRLLIAGGADLTLRNMYKENIIERPIILPPNFERELIDVTYHTILNAVGSQAFLPDEITEIIVDYTLQNRTMRILYQEHIERSRAQRQIKHGD